MLTETRKISVWPNYKGITLVKLLTRVHAGLLGTSQIKRNNPVKPVEVVLASGEDAPWVVIQWGVKCMSHGELINIAVS